ncbi:MAG TPA: hypothetical protein VF584_20610 [Longimicrobium sp.]|jgi:hypothetical protein
MDATDLLEPVLTNGIRLNNFFNGRILTAEDLRAEQQAVRGRDRQLAHALGEGVAHGLEVAAAGDVEETPVLSIQPGLAFNRDGDAVALGRPVELRLVSVEEEAAAEAGIFAVCKPRHVPLELTNVGLYVLTASPASALSEERAPMAELGSEGIAGSCASRWALEGARFSVAPLPLASAGETPTPLALALAELVQDVEEKVELVRRGGASATPAVRTALDQELSRLRNGAAYLCFGVDRLAGQSASPFAAESGFPDPEYGAVDGMRARRELASCEVPIALFYLSQRGVEWVDAWAVRRPLVPQPSAGTLPVLHDRRREAEALAMVLQFQQQVAELVASTMTTAQLTLVEAAQRFRFLPPCGLLPLREAGVGRGLAHAVFFRGLTLGPPSPLSGAKLQRVLRHALPHAPVDLSSRTAQVVLWRTRDNLPAAGGGSPPAPYAVFVTRETMGPRVRDTLAVTLETAWSAWRGVVRKRLFLPPGTDADKVAAQVSIVNAVRDVMDVATRQAALAGGNALDTRDALEALRELHRVQDDLQTLFRSSIPGVVHTQGRENFGAGVNVRLNTALPGGGRALLPAIEAADLPGAVAAQAAINQFVAGFSGEGVASGPIVVTYQSSPRGLNLVPGDTEGFPHLFTVRNATDRRLTFRLQATAAGTAGDWSNAVTLEDATGAVLTAGTVELASGAQTTVAARVRPPASGIAAGQQVVLTFRATVDPPNDRDVSATRQLTVSSDEGGAVSGSLEVLAPTSLPFNLDDAPPGQVGSFLFHVRYAGPATLPSPVNVNVTVTLTSAEAVWQAEFGGVATANPSPGVFTTTVSATLGQQVPLDLLVLMPARTSTDRTATLNVHVQAAAGGPAPVPGDLAPPLALRVRHS